MKSRICPALAATLLVALVLTGCGSPATKPLAVSAGETPSSDAVALPGELDEQVQRALEQLPEIAQQGLDSTGVPGMSIAVVFRDEVVFAEGFGVREVGTDEGITPDTVFQIASLSKPLSATAVSAAIADGDVSWETPIRTLLPEFEYSDPTVTELATIGDAFSHRTGLSTGAGDDLEDLGFDRDTILQRLRFQPLDDFRSTYHYSNFGLTIGAEAVAVARGQEWADLVAELVFDPIGMESTSARHDDYLSHPDRALLHAVIDGEFVAAFDRDPDAQAPAGGVSSTANDLAQWLRVLLDDGALDGTQIADSDALVAAMSPQIVSSHPGAGIERPSHYGHGFNASPLVSGRMSISHSGAFVLGAATNFQVVPELDLGIVVLTNGAPVGLPEAVTASFLDLVQFGDITRDWVADLGAFFGPMTGPAGDLVEVDRPPSPEPAPSDPSVTGLYVSDYFGSLEVERDRGALIARLGAEGSVALELEEWDGATFAYSPSSESAPWGSLSTATFELDGDGKALSLRLSSFDEMGLGTFTRVWLER
ncbi:serine hydrolase [Leucobacter sp. W1478]|uniref:serine hydrolase n=1 Tax=Leucobacter sp. W1478 TaxID=3439065 RepID=UPI003F2A828F